MVWKDFSFQWQGGCSAAGFHCCPRPVWLLSLLPTWPGRLQTAWCVGGLSASVSAFVLCGVGCLKFNGRFKSTSTVYGKTHGLVIWPWWWSWKTVHCMSLLPFMDGLESGFLVNTSVFSIQIYYETILLHVNSCRLHFNDRSCMSCFFSKVSLLLPQLICPFHGSSSFRAVKKTCFALKIHLTVGAFYQPLFDQPIL